MKAVTGMTTLALPECWVAQWPGCRAIPLFQKKKYERNKLLEIGVVTFYIVYEIIRNGHESSHLFME